VKKIFFCLLLVNTLTTKAQSLKWYDGSVVLTTGGVIIGKMVVEPALNVLLVQQNNVRTVYPAHKIKSLYYYDDSSDINRRYISLRDKSTLYNHYQLFEIVVQGEVDVLRKQETKSRNPSDALDFTYYVSYRDDVMLLKKFGKKVYPHLKSSMETLDDFVSSNHLRQYDCSNSITIIEYYNRQLRADMITAKH
jgi:hypothetical protein